MYKSMGTKLEVLKSDSGEQKSNVSNLVDLISYSVMSLSHLRFLGDLPAKSRRGSRLVQRGGGEVSLE